MAHLAIQGVPIFAVTYGVPSTLILPLSQAWHAVVGMGNSCLFLISLAKRVHFTAVSLICVRPNAAPAPRPVYRCTLTVESPDDEDTYVEMTSMVSTSALPGGLPVPGDETPYLKLTPDLIPSDGTLEIGVLIHQLQAAPAA